MRRMYQVCAILGITMFSTGVSATDYFVDGSVASSGDGSTWAQAKKYLSDALLLATVDGDEIWIAAGTYYPDESDANPTGTGNRSDIFVIDKDIRIYGGFAGGELFSSERNAVANPVVLSGEIQGDGVASNNSYHVIRIEDSQLDNHMPQVDSVTITGGFADLLTGTEDQFGGGILIYKSDAIVSNVIMDGNEAGVLGDGGGGGAHVEGCAGLFGCPENEPNDVRFINCIFRNNRSNSVAGGICNSAAIVTMVNCLIHENHAVNEGGGALAGDNGVWNVVNSTIVDNTSTNRSAGIEGGTGAALIENCILWGNESDGTLEEQQIQISGSPTVQYNCIEGLNVWAGNNNIGTDPEFFDASADMYQLKVTSPCVDTGNTALLDEADVADLDRDGNTFEVTPLDVRLRDRFLDGLNNGTAVVDRGAYEKGEFCSSDLNGDDEVDVLDLLVFLAAWGDCPLPCPPACVGDFNADCKVDTQDLLVLLAEWGYCGAQFGTGAPVDVMDCLNRYSDPTQITKCIEAMVLSGGS